MFQVTVNNILGRRVGHPSSIPCTREHSHALQALFLSPSAGWWDGEELVRLSPEGHCTDRAAEQGHPWCPQPSPGGLWESRALSRCSDAAPSLHDCTEFQESPSSGLNHLALHLPHPGFTVQSNCSSTGLAS